MTVRVCVSALDLSWTVVSAAEIRRPPVAGGGRGGGEGLRHSPPPGPFLKKPLGLCGALGDFSWPRWPLECAAEEGVS